jgi:hypothetical protein
MTLRGVPVLTIIVLLGLGVQAKALAPCAEVLRLRNAASEAWKHTMSARHRSAAELWPKPLWPRRRRSTTRTITASHATSLIDC